MIGKKNIKRRMSGRGRFLAVAGALALSLLGGVAEARAQDAQASREYLIKAAILYNFARFTEWPAPALDDKPSFRLCVLGDDPFGPALKSIEGKPVQGRPVAIVRLADANAAADCHLLYVGETAAGGMNLIVDAVDAAPVLLVGESENFARTGGHIEMRTVDDRVRFGINQDGAERGGLKFSAKLLNLADPAFDGGQRSRYATPR